MEEESEPNPSQQDPAPSGDASILFDEDRFFHLKTLRADGCYLPLLLGEQYFSPSDTGQQQDDDGAPPPPPPPREGAGPPSLRDVEGVEQGGQPSLDSKSDFALDHQSDHQ